MKKQNQTSGSKAPGLIASIPVISEKYDGQAEQLFEQISNPKIHNVGVIGGFGAGKTSLVETCIENHIRNPKSKKHRKEQRGRRIIKENRIRRVSLLTRRQPVTLNQKGNAEDPAPNQWEVEIVQQLLFSEISRNTVWSRFERVVNNRLRTIVSAILLVVLIASIVLFGFLKESFPAEWDKWLKWVLFSATFVLSLIFLLSFLPTFKLKKIVLNSKIGSAEWESTYGKNSTPTAFDVYCDELLYFFCHFKTRLVIFEDLDRAEGQAAELLEKLRNLNTMANQCRSIKNKQGICFVYCVGGKLYSNPTGANGEPDSETISKIFDVTLSVVPINNIYNIAEYILAEIQNRSIEPPEAGTLLVLSKFIKNNRVANLVINDYYTFYRNNEEQDEGIMSGKSARSTLFSLVVMKNVDPFNYEKFLEKGDDAILQGEKLQEDGVWKNLIDAIQVNGLAETPCWKYISLFRGEIFGSKRDKDFYDYATCKTSKKPSEVILDNPSKIVRLLPPATFGRSACLNISLFKELGAPEFKDKLKKAVEQCKTGQEKSFVIQATKCLPSVERDNGLWQFVLGVLAASPETWFETVIDVFESYSGLEQKEIAINQLLCKAPSVFKSSPTPYQGSVNPRLNSTATFIKNNHLRMETFRNVDKTLVSALLSSKPSFKTALFLEEDGMEEINSQVAARFLFEFNLENLLAYCKYKGIPASPGTLFTAMKRDQELVKQLRQADRAEEIRAVLQKINETQTMPEEDASGYGLLIDLVSNSSKDLLIEYLSKAVGFIDDDPSFLNSNAIKVLIEAKKLNTNKDLLFDARRPLTNHLQVLMDVYAYHDKKDRKDDLGTIDNASSLYQQIKNLKKDSLPAFEEFLEKVSFVFVPADVSLFDSAKTIVASGCYKIGNTWIQLGLKDESILSLLVQHHFSEVVNFAENNSVLWDFPKAKILFDCAKTKEEKRKVLETLQATLLPSLLQADPTVCNEPYFQKMTFLSQTLNGLLSADAIRPKQLLKVLENEKAQRKMESSSLKGYIQTHYDKLLKGAKIREEPYRFGKRTEIGRLLHYYATACRGSGFIEKDSEEKYFSFEGALP